MAHLIRKTTPKTMSIIGRIATNTLKIAGIIVKGKTNKSKPLRIIKKNILMGNNTRHIPVFINQIKILIRAKPIITTNKMKIGSMHLSSFFQLNTKKITGCFPLLSELKNYDLQFIYNSIFE